MNVHYFPNAPRTDTDIIIYVMVCPKVGGTNPFVPPTSESAGAQAPAAPFSYALAICIWLYTTVCS